MKLPKPKSKVIREQEEVAVIQRKAKEEEYKIIEAAVTPVATHD